MSATERMIAFHLARLRDKDAQVRLKSIKELVLLEASQCLAELEKLYRNDPDESVRKAAQDAGRKLYVLKAEKERQHSGDDSGDGAS